MKKSYLYTTIFCVFVSVLSFSNQDPTKKKNADEKIKTENTYSSKKIILTDSINLQSAPKVGIRNDNIPKPVNVESTIAYPN